VAGGPREDPIRAAYACGGSCRRAASKTDEDRLKREETVSAENYLAREVETAERAVCAAGEIIMGFYRRDFDIRDKGKGNPVTTADLEANRKLQEVILASFPADGWLSEEDHDNLNRLRAERVWVVDPIDGTKEFIAGIPQFAVSVGLVAKGRPILGIVFNPVEGELYRAVGDRGALLNGEPIHVSARTEVEGALLLVSRSEPRRKFARFAEACILEPIGSIAYRLAKVAAGKGDATLTFRSIHEWDVCAGVLMVEQAGGLVLDGAGKRLVFNQTEAVHRGIVASNENLARPLQEMLAKSMVEAK
jgi:myo-inositol-1(or 4)-monophosphatase